MCACFAYLPMPMARFTNRRMRLSWEWLIPDVDTQRKWKKDEKTQACTKWKGYKQKKNALNCRSRLPFRHIIIALCVRAVLPIRFLFLFYCGFFLCSFVCHGALSLHHILVRAAMHTDGRSRDGCQTKSLVAKQSCVASRPAQIHKSAQLANVDGGIQPTSRADIPHYLLCSAMCSVWVCGVLFFIFVCLPMLPVMPTDSKRSVCR